MKAAIKSEFDQIMKRIQEKFDEPATHVEEAKHEIDSCSESKTFCLKFEGGFARVCLYTPKEKA